MRPQKRSSRCLAPALGWVAGALMISVGLSVLVWQQVGAEGRGSAPAICWVLAVAGIAGTAMASTGGRFGWLLLFGLQPLWIAYALTTDQIGLVVGPMAYAVAQLNGFLKTARKQNASCG